MAYLAAIGGALMGAGGAFLSGNAGDIKRQRLLDVANTPGVDVNALTGQALANEQQYAPQAEQLSAQLGTAAQSQLLAQEEQALPGIGAARQSALANIQGLLGGTPAFQQRVQQLGGIAGVQSGLFGSGAGQLQSVYQGYQLQNQATQLGTGLLNSLIGSMRIANTPGAQAFLGPTADQLINIRSQERAQSMNLRAQAAGVPGQTAAWANYLTQQGGMLEGAGLMGMGAGGGGGNGGAGGSFTLGNYQQNMNMAAESGGAYNPYGY